MSVPSVRCFGAVRTVTGSMHLLEANDDRILLDCGLYQGRRSEARKRNAKLPFDARSITSVVLSHAHIDHSGNLPSLVKAGFQGPIYCTPATLDLCQIMLLDAAYIQEKDAAYYNRKAKKRKSDDRIEPLYTEEDARAAIDLMRGVPYGHGFTVGNGVRCEFRDAGHIIGSASVGLTIDAGNGVSRRLTFTGDVGRDGSPILRDPAPIAPADLIISESTYGNKMHPEYDAQEKLLLDIVKRTADRGGKVIVPAFSVGRTQNLVYWLHRLFLDGRLPRLPIFVDSPLSSRATLVYRGHPECYDKATHQTFLEEGLDPFGFEDLTYITAVENSKALNERKDPCIIIAASGMVESGRILHHLKHNARDPRSTVLIVGFMAEHTLGRRLVDGAPDIKVYGDVVPLKAEVARMNGLSAHADRGGLLEMFKELPQEGRARALLVHGEVDRSEALVQPLAELGTEAVLPVVGQRFEI
ncbi:MAG: MBL fold metallo-hydrolase [Planctomycetota bacterium]